MNKNLIFTLFLAIQTTLIAQVPFRDQSFQLGTTGGLESLNMMRVNSKGELICTYHYLNNLDFDISPSTLTLGSQGTDVALVKYDENFNLIWAKQISGPDADDSYGLGIDQNDNIYMSGRFNGTTDFDPSAASFNLTSNGQNDCFIAKYDDNGSLVWVVAFGGTDSDYTYGLELDTLNKMVYVKGAFRDQVDFDPGTGVHNVTSMGSEDAFITKFNFDGNFIDVFTLQSSDAMGIADFELLDKHIYLSGSFLNTVDFDPTGNLDNHTSGGNYDSYITKIDTNFNYIWTKTITSATDVRLGTIDSDEFGNLYISGTFENTVDFDIGPGTNNLTSQGDDDIFFGRVDTTFSLDFISAVGGTLEDRSSVIINKPNGGFFMSGQLYRNGCVNPNSSDDCISTMNGRHAYYQEYDSLGNEIWTTFIQQSSSMAFMYDMLYYSDTLVVTGTFSDQLDVIFNDNLDTTYNSFGSSDIFLRRYVNCSATQTTITDTVCYTYVSPDGFTTDQSGTHNYTLQSVNGCDSNITINLIVVGLDSTVTQNGSLLTSIQTNCNYQWIDCNTGNDILFANGQSLQVTQNGSYQVELEQYGCSTTSQCITVDLTNIEENKLLNMEVYPNPFVNSINVKGFAMDSEYVILDALGKEVLIGNLKTSSIINASSLNNGIYFLKIKKEYFKIVKR